MIVIGDAMTVIVCVRLDPLTAPFLKLEVWEWPGMGTTSNLVESQIRPAREIRPAR